MFRAQTFRPTVVVLMVLGCTPADARAQDALTQEPTPHHEHQQPQEQHQHGAKPQAPADEHTSHAGHTMSLFDGRDTAGTGWAPISTPMLATHLQLGAWTAMVMGNGFVSYLQEFAPEHRGSHQVNGSGWLLGMTRRRAGAGVVGARVMLSPEPLTVPGCGYPDLLATGELCDGDGIHDRQHPHDLLIELAAEYSRPLARGLRWHVYGGPAGEPALGPVAFPHRASAMANPIAPISHHWLDATHITYGVVTSGISGSRWRAEASLFNGREPDEHRWDLDFGRMDSVSGRLQLLPTDRFALQVSAGRLEEAEAGEGSLPRRDVDRVTASAMYQGTLGGRPAAWMLGWGANTETGIRTHAALAEANVAVTPAHTFFGRAEIAGKRGHDLHIHEAERSIFTVGKIQAGYVRLLAPLGGVQAGLGGSVSASFVPDALQARYGGVAMGVGVFATLRPTVALR
jgi:hypothetical protein